MARILVAEDDESVRAFVVRAMQLQGHEVVQAADGAWHWRRCAPILSICY